MFPQKYRGGIFSAQHGSWNRTTPVGARVMFTSLKEDGTADKTEVFAEGWLTENGEYLGRPGRCRPAAGRIDPGLRRLRRCRLPHLVRRPVIGRNRAATCACTWARSRRWGPQWTRPTRHAAVALAVLLLASSRPAPAMSPPAAARPCSARPATGSTDFRSCRKPLISPVSLSAYLVKSLDEYRKRRAQGRT